MKKLLLASTALLGLAAVSTPAAAEINMDLGGHFRGYGVYSDSDVAGSNAREFDFRRDTEIHFTGEATSDNGLTVGAHYEAMVGGELLTDEAYAYFSGNWGRVNFGSEDGAAYLLQVAAPSADSNVDGLRSSVQMIDSTALGSTFDGGAVIPGYTGSLSQAFGTNAGATANNLLMDYDHADFQDTDRLTYLTPKYMGFQAGFSYAPEAGQNAIGNSLSAAETDNDVNQFEDLWELAVRWDGEFQGFGLSAGGGYSNGSIENGTAGLAVLNGTEDGDGILEASELDAASLFNVSDDLDTWNAGLNIAFQGFTVGGAYLKSESDLSTAVDEDGVAGVETFSADVEAETWVIGAAWDNGPYHVGVSYLNQEVDHGTASIEADKTTVGAGYTYGPGMSFRGAVAFGAVDDNVGAATDEDFTQVTIGTDIQF